ncbi:MAG: hypothetical protein J5679_02330 [Alphaproteobacteria bacterium]|nr:hypothetical protein [Alphaproteobacteria bacterium]
MKRNILSIFMIVAFATLDINAASVVSRTSRSSITRAGTQTTTATTDTTSPAPASQENTVKTTDEQPATVPAEPETIITDKSSQFSTILSDMSSTDTDYGAMSLAEMIRAQRTALDAESNTAANTISMRAATIASTNSCDTALRTCMTEKCGAKFTNCANDTDTAFGAKLDSCRRNTNCDANEYTSLASEIKADRTINIQLKLFDDILDCGQEYDSCITNICGTTYAKCLGKSDGDTAISRCASIANRCKSVDNGLAARTTNVFATLRQTAEQQIAKDEQKLYSLREQMKSACARMGAMFDERTLDCVYTVNFRAGDDATIYASKKVYAGGTFDCTPNWFGVDVTTFKENAYRLTREQTSASSAMLGAGLGTAVGAITSGAMSDAIEQSAVKKAERQEKKEAKQEQKEQKQAAKQEQKEQKEQKQAEKQEQKEQKQAAKQEQKEQKQAERQQKKDERQAAREERRNNK